MFRFTAIAELWKRDEAAARAELVDALATSGGCVVRAAHLLAMTRRQLYRWITRAELWAELDRIREEAQPEPEMFTRAREAFAAVMPDDPAA